MTETLLHTCCGPCASACVPMLKEKGRHVTLFFANSNIDTKAEYEKRLTEARKLAAAEGVEIVALPYDHEEWLREVAFGYEYESECGARCARCFRYNLGKTAEYAKRHRFDSFTTSLSVSPHKVNTMIFKAGESYSGFEPISFKANGGYLKSVARANELGLYRQAYCGCEFSKEHWRVHKKEETVSTNLDARSGQHLDVFVADYQTSGRGRLDHKWLSPPKTNLMMSAVVSVAALPIERVVTLPLIAGLAVRRAVASMLPKEHSVMLKWPNDVWVDGRKIAGLLCERVGEHVIIGIGVNVNQRAFPEEIAARATSLALLSGGETKVSRLRSRVLDELLSIYRKWRDCGFSACYDEIRAVDFLRGKYLEVRQTDLDPEPLRGLCEGIRPDGTLRVAGVDVYAGEAHVENIGVGV